MILETKDLCKSFGSLNALQNVDLTVEKGKILGIAGPNGAGKSTLFNVIAGHYPLSAGKIDFNGEDITRLNSHQVCHRGLVRTFQVPTTFKTLTVYDNIRVGSTFGRKDFKASKGIIEETIELLGLNEYRDTEASHLDLYTTKMVMLAACLATDCKLLMLDEPLAGLAMNEIEDFLQVIRKISGKGGITIIMIEHILDTLIEISDHMLVLDNGTVIYTGSPEGVFEDQQVIECYLGKVEE
ncbi:MAG: ABC transporter ATP-binding protein [Deltaproteobacteria bacterium]|jgi:branched-chain amino acid transport system ATP-binding protein|nr:ABC transporter ATP-binding protein [Deltaproteobacteria bacterium]MBT4269530.1 ABC transporter ATP-binding protein [Deltaproteobacteria bacterium]MBT4642627.1 ABC transporter ATP-binding protein [Deltaproteobacteria bacterium]MBT6501290.1 ABC transporter ATP-binding protein [Deltaproteobacteria bacterium]MBT6615414.1 ABC transporter ATP-binding protein [Deltaproteobacteria bacterium]